jgi:hypothetical protein
MVRAKFRVMEISRHWNGEHTSVRLLPVGPKGECYPDGCEENKAFWEWTPGGEMSLNYGTVVEGDVPFLLGKAYYVDMTPTGDARWELEVNSQYEAQLDVALRCPWAEEGMRSGSITMSIMNTNAWRHFQGPGPGSKWSVEFTEAEG